MTHRCQLRIKYNRKEDLQDFYITNLGKDRIILGYPFLEKFNPKIDWAKGQLTEGPVVIQMAMFKHLDRMVVNWQNKARRQLGDPKKDEAIYVRRLTLSQKMMEEYRKGKLKEEATVPPEF